MDYLIFRTEVAQASVQKNEELQRWSSCQIQSGSAEPPIAAYGWGVFARRPHAVSILADRFHVQRDQPKGKHDHSNRNKWQSRRHNFSVTYFGSMPNKKI
jgi:hypothetical protein